MSTTETIDVRYVARLARLTLSDEEAATFQPQLEHILGYVHELSALNVDGVEPTAHALDIVNVFRPDRARPGLDHDSVMANAPLERGGQFIVPRILE